MDLIQLKDIAIDAAYTAGQLIKEYASEDVIVNKKSEPSSYAAQVVTEVDLNCEKIIKKLLQPVSETLSLIHI